MITKYRLGIAVIGCSLILGWLLSFAVAGPPGAGG